MMMEMQHGMDPQAAIVAGRWRQAQRSSRTRPWARLAGICSVAAALLIAPSNAVSQDAASRNSPDTQPGSEADQLRTLTETVRELQAEVKALTAQLAELRAREQARQPGEGAESGSAQDTKPRNGAQDAPAGSDPSSASASAAPAGAVAAAAPGASSAQTIPPTLEQRLEALEEGQQLADAKISDQYQTKVESGSKYRVRLSGIVLLNLFENRGSVDNLDFPEFAEARAPLDSSGSFGGSLRQSQVGLEVFGPDLAGAHTSANLKFDFAGGFAGAPNGVTEGLVRLRTGTIRMDWQNTSIVAGQDYLFFAPLAPTSLATLAIPALSYSGNLWAWVPQLRLEHGIDLTAASHLELQAGILDPMSGDLPYDEYYRYPSWGEMSGQPGYAARIAWSHRVFDQNLTLGMGGYFERQDWGFGRNLDSWAGTADVTIPLGRLFAFSGEFYRGSALGGLGGAIGQDVVLNGSITDPGTIIEGLDSMGGWAQLKFKPMPKVEVNGAFGQDNPFARELRTFSSTAQSYYGELLARNRSPMVNVIYQVRSNVLFSVELRHLRTFGLGDSVMANHINFSAGYQF